MSPRNFTLRVEDILNAITAIQSYTSGITFDVFAHDDKTVDAVMHNIMVIGEAANHVSGDVAAQYPAIPWDKMRAIRNIVVHMYFGIRRDILWHTVLNDLPPLVEPLRTIISEQR